jgi:DNA polymerase-3 subunit alpha
MCKFCHLHVHSDASKDGCGKVENLVRYASELGMTKLALTDHGTLSGWIRFALSCQENNIQPIAGLEGYIEVDGKRGHITVLSDGDKGFNSLVQLHNTAHLRSESYKDMATFTPDELIKYNEGLILLTGCVASPLHSMSLTEAVSLGNRFKSVFNDRMFAEIMHVSESSDIWLRSIYLSEQLNIPLVATNDVHLHRKEDAPRSTISSYDLRYNSFE